jgi:predicted nucleic acid-binding protein
MSAKPFIDTNVLVYAFASNDSRKEKAEELLTAGGMISVQVLNEFVNVLHRKQQRDWDEIIEALEVVTTLLDRPMPLTLDIHASAIKIARAHRFSFYDSLIVAAALEAGCSILYTEDLQHGRKFGQLTITNPFLP